MFYFEQIGFIPRSIVRTFKRFINQVQSKNSLLAIYEFQISRHIIFVSLKCFFFLFICPWIFKLLFKNLLIYLFTSYLDKKVFVNFHQQEQAFSQIQNFSQKIYFETLLDSFNLSEKSSDFLPKTYSSYFLECAKFYNKQNIIILTNWLTDITTILIFRCLLVQSTSQIIIFKTFCIDSLLNLKETTKCFLLIFFLDLLVGFHSSKSWEVFLQYWIEHYGFQINKNFSAFFISTFPVLLDTILKYWIFRYLNKISPSTVATYQAMIE